MFLIFERWFKPILETLPGGRRAAAAALVLAPLALGAALTLRWTRPAPAPLAFVFGHEKWIEQARQAARQVGMDASTWTPSVSVHQNESAVRRAVAGESSLGARLHPLATIIVNLKEPEGNGAFEARFAQSGDLLKWSASGNAADSVPRGSPRPQAESLLRRLGAMTLTEFKPAMPGKDSEYQGIASYAEDSREKIPVKVSLRDGRVEGASIATDDEGSKDATALEQTAGLCAVALICFFSIYGLRLYRRRWREGEIPRGRALLLVAVFGLCGFFFAALNPESLEFRSGWDALLSLGIAMLAGLGNSLAFMAGGLLVAAAYASAEGEIREGWPGKLVSFDALLAGKCFTRSTGIAAAIAAGIASWAFLCAALAGRLGPARDAALLDGDLLALALGRNVLLRSLADLPLRVSFLIVAGLFMPLAFIHRRRWRGWKSWTLLLASPLLVDAGLRSFSLSGMGSVVTSLGMAAVLGASFYFADVLAAVFGVLLYGALTMSSSIAAAVPPLAFTQGLLVAAVLLALAPIVVAAWRGPAVDEAAVRPTYARNLVQRLSLRAEVNAAREAQLRLLPRAMPQRSDLSVAAYCQPAGVVGGDFYDFFAAPGGRLGVFVASGGGLGLASALTIAMAKGFLWSEVKRGETPEASLAALLQTLSGRVGAAAERTGLLLMLVDAAKGEVILARRGDFPAVWLVRGEQCWPLELSASTARPVQTATFGWHPGEALIAHTEGLPMLLDDQSPSGQRRWFEVTARHTVGAPASWIEQDLRVRLGGRGGKRLRLLRLDLTAVVLRNHAS